MTRLFLATASLRESIDPDPTVTTPSDLVDLSDVPVAVDQ